MSPIITKNSICVLVGAGFLFCSFYKPVAEKVDFPFVFVIIGSAALTFGALSDEQ
jgi:hypothetical protein